MMSESVLIVGGGQAAAQLVVSLRQGGHQGPITLVSEEDTVPYQRPPLSKQYLGGTLERPRLLLRKPEYYESRGVELLLVGGSHPSTATGSGPFWTAAGNSLRPPGAGHGSSLRRLDVPGGSLPGIHYLRSLDDSDRLRAELVVGRRIVIVGGGYIGLEVAATAAKMGAQVTVLERCRG